MVWCILEDIKLTMVNFSERAFIRIFIHCSREAFFNFFALLYLCN